VGILATGSLKVIGARLNGLPGIIVRLMEEESSWTCSVTGAICWITRLVLFKRSVASVPDIFQSVGEQGQHYNADADEATYATFQLAGGIVAQFNSSWCTRVRRDELVNFHVDGTHGSAVAGLTSCVTQHRVNTPKPVLNPDVPNPIDFQACWDVVPDVEVFGNGFHEQWKMFLLHVAEGAPWKYDLMAGARGVQLAELGMQSWAERRWLDVPDLEV
jgi:predicted dehydrogenase